MSFPTFYDDPWVAAGTKKCLDNQSTPQYITDKLDTRRPSNEFLSQKNIKLMVSRVTAIMHEYGVSGCKVTRRISQELPHKMKQWAIDNSIDRTYSYDSNLLNLTGNNTSTIDYLNDKFIRKINTCFPGESNPGHKTVKTTICNEYEKYTIEKPREFITADDIRNRDVWQPTNTFMDRPINLPYKPLIGRRYLAKGDGYANDDAEESSRVNVPYGYDMDAIYANADPKQWYKPDNLP